MLASDPEGPELPKSFRASFSTLLLGSSDKLNVSLNNGEALGCFSCGISVTVLPSIKSEGLRTLVAFYLQGTMLHF